MNGLNHTTLFKKLAFFAAIAGLSSFISVPGLAQVKSQFNQAGTNAFELAQGGDSGSGGSSDSGGGQNNPSNIDNQDPNSPNNINRQDTYPSPEEPSGDEQLQNNQTPPETPSNTSAPAEPTSSPSRSNSQSSLSTQDRDFLTRAAQNGMAEVQLGRMAMQRGSTNAVKEYGRRMVEEHTRANAELMQLASQKGVTPPTDLGKYQAVMDRLSRLSGDSFDEAYMREMVNAHTEAVNLFQAQAQKGQDSQLKAWASNLVPNLQAHLQMANQMAQSMR